MLLLSPSIAHSQAVASYVRGGLDYGDYPGLEEYVRSACIIAPWSQVKAVERHERSLDKVKAVNELQWPGRDHPIEEAVNTGVSKWRPQFVMLENPLGGGAP